MSHAKKETFQDLIRTEGVQPKGRPRSDTQSSSPEVPKEAQKEAPKRRESTAQTDGGRSPEPNTWRRHDVRGNEFRRLRQGKSKLRPGQEHDVHGETRATIADKLDKILEGAVLRKREVILIVCGRGHHSKDGRPILRPAIGEHLRGHRSVRAYTLAQKKHGGDGAYYVLLKTRGKYA